MISAASIVFSAFAAAAMLAASTRFGAERIELFILAAVLIEGRLLANLLDGLVAVEGGLGSKSGGDMESATRSLQRCDCAGSGGLLVCAYVPQ